MKDITIKSDIANIFLLNDGCIAHEFLQPLYDLIQGKQWCLEHEQSIEAAVMEGRAMD
jgi:hypothetical protein